MSSAHRAPAPTAPARGSFPLDHEGACKDYKEDFMQCMKRNQWKHYKCAEQSREYLQCRMDKGLMTEEDLNSLGFGPDRLVQQPASANKQKEEDPAEQGDKVIAGLEGTKKKKGTLFGIKW
eukprot:gb/GECG01004086.1/.p1 GENE.gb/GECG01004086.1/~~gb/GECG01004086.1/.p1  ORF type:complete len:121 (+),score=20.48 gb/GECG01004086.1/:1-363(+)